MDSAPPDLSRSFAWSFKWRRLGRSGRGRGASPGWFGICELLSSIARRPHLRAERSFAMNFDAGVGFYPFRGPDAPLRSCANYITKELPPRAPVDVEYANALRNANRPCRRF